VERRGLEELYPDQRVDRIMIVGHLSDTHLGWYNKEAAAEERENDYYEAFIETIDLFIREHVDIVIHSGDILDTPRPYGTAVRTLIDGVMKLSKNGIPFLFTLGEHDIASVKSTPYPRILERLGIGVYVGNSELHEVKGLTVTGLHKHRRYERDILVQRLEAIASKLSQTAGKRVLILHQCIKEAAGPWAEISIEDIPAGFDYYAMGDYHRQFIRLHGRGILSYSGPTHWVDVDDPDRCGVNIVDLSGGEPIIHRVELESVRPKLRLKVNGEGLESLLNDLMGRSYSKKPCLWLEVEARDVVNTSRLENLLREKYIIHELSVTRPAPVSQPASSPQGPSIDEELKRLVVEALDGRGDIASFVLDDLLPALAEKGVKEGPETVWNYYLKGGWE
jgi:exonuclease SbcD